MTLTFPSFAKINWTLEILGKRPDGYHELRTLLQTIDLADELRFSRLKEGIEVECEEPGIPTGEDNLVHRAARLLRDFAGLRAGVRVEIVKRIPAAGGLGGGSGNAAVTLLVLQSLWNLRLSTGDLFALGSKLGADVPFFFLGGTCLGVGRGDEVYPLADHPPANLLLVNPGIAVPTAEVYANLPPELTNRPPVAKMPLSLEAAYASLADRHRLLKPDRFGLQNDLETSVLTRYPLLDEIKRRLETSGASGVLMSGSGSTIFAIFDSEKARSGARHDLSDTGWWCAPARTLSREEYLSHYLTLFA